MKKPGVSRSVSRSVSRLLLLSLDKPVISVMTESLGLSCGTYINTSTYKHINTQSYRTIISAGDEKYFVLTMLSELVKSIISTCINRSLMLVCICNWEIHVVVYVVRDLNFLHFIKSTLEFQSRKAKERERGKERERDVSWWIVLPVINYMPKV